MGWSFSRAERRERSNRVREIRGTYRSEGRVSRRDYSSSYERVTRSYNSRRERSERRERWYSRITGAFRRRDNGPIREIPTLDSYMPRSSSGPTEKDYLGVTDYVNTKMSEREARKRERRERDHDSDHDSSWYRHNRGRGLGSKFVNASNGGSGGNSSSQEGGNSNDVPIEEIVENLYTLEELRRLKQNNGEEDPQKLKAISNTGNLVNNSGIDVDRINFAKSIKVPYVDEDTLKRILKGGV